MRFEFNGRMVEGVLFVEVDYYDTTFTPDDYKDVALFKSDQPGMPELSLALKTEDALERIGRKLTPKECEDGETRLLCLARLQFEEDSEKSVYGWIGVEVEQGLLEGPTV